jgi:hypothetical protein
MNEEGDLRESLSKVYVLLSRKVVDPERMKAANEKMDEVIGILSGLVPLAVAEGERG